MYLVLLKKDGEHILFGLGETLEEIKKLIKNGNIQDKIEKGKAYLIKGDITLIRPETTPDLLDIKGVKNDKDRYY